MRTSFAFKKIYSKHKINRTRFTRMFLISLLLIGSIAIAIENEKELLSVEQTELVTISVTDK